MAVLPLSVTVSLSVTVPLAMAVPFAAPLSVIIFVAVAAAGFVASTLLAGAAVVPIPRSLSSAERDRRVSERVGRACGGGMRAWASGVPGSGAVGFGLNAVQAVLQRADQHLTAIVS